MRTTLTIDDELAAALKEVAYNTGRSFKDVVNQTLRRGLAADALPPQTRPYRLQPMALGGVRPDIDLDKALQIADALEDEGIGRKLELRK